MDSHDIFVKKKLKKAASLVARNSKVLDVGCYDGSLNNFLDNCDYYGIDADKKMISMLAKRGIKARCTDLNKDPLPFKNEKFDYVFLLDIVEHVVDPAKLLKEAKERIKKSGKLVVTLPNDYHILNKLRFIFNKHLTEDPFDPYGHLHFFPIKSGEKLLLKQGFKILKKIKIPPVKPSFIPQPIKNMLTNFFPQSFARDVLYLLTLK